ncbi:MAG TPA: cytochrome c oxidase subunit I [Actinomycetota bacterium]|jgi:cytochrome c oxidase subunit 1/cytochrome c oxidase subunit I+III|nr:cytochrome c oxidase subunit I [Actinomycetota bacterium]
MKSPVVDRLTTTWTEEPGLFAWMSTTDHKRIGKRYLYTALILFVAGGIESLLIRAQLSQANLELLDPEAYNQLFSMHGITMIFLFVIPALSGFGNYFVPLQIGTRDMAFPRLNAFGYWVFAFGGLFMYSSFLLGKAPNNGWFNYVPLGDERFTPGVNIDFFALGMIFLGVSTTAGAINFIVTILKLRAPGMSLNRMPIFVWGELGMALTAVFSFPAVTLAAVLLELERGLGFHFFDASNGGDPLLWQHLFWIFGHPLVYLIILPALGITATVLPAFCRRPIVGYTYIVLGEMGVALLGFGVWVHHMFSVGLPQISLSFISITSFMITIPSGIVVLAWLSTILAGRPVLKTPMLFTLGFIVIFVIGGLSGVMFAAIPFDQALTDSYFVVAHFHYVMVGGTMFPIFAAIYYWAPKMNGRLLSESWGKLSFWLMFVGFNLAFFPMHITGLLGQPRRTYTYEAGLGWDLWNLLETVGAGVLTVGILITFLAWWRAREPAPPNPWNAETLEWATSSPPPAYNFAAIPTVRSREPVWDQPDLRDGRQPVDSGGRPLEGGHVTLVTSLLDARPEVVAKMPHASSWPLILTLALTTIFTGLLARASPIVVAGSIGAIIGVMGWLWPRGQSQET